MRLTVELQPPLHTTQTCLRKRLRLQPRSTLPRGSPPVSETWPAAVCGHAPATPGPGRSQRLHDRLAAKSPAPERAWLHSWCAHSAGAREDQHRGGEKLLGRHLLPAFSLAHAAAHPAVVSCDRSLLALEVVAMLRRGRIRRTAAPDVHAGRTIPTTVSASCGRATRTTRAPSKCKRCAARCSAEPELVLLPRRWCWLLGELCA